MILKHCNHDPAMVADTPLSPLEKLVPNTEPAENTNCDAIKQYQSDIGSLMYLMLGTRCLPEFQWRVRASREELGEARRQSSTSCAGRGLLRKD